MIRQCYKCKHAKGINRAIAASKITGRIKSFTCTLYKHNLSTIVYRHIRCGGELPTNMDLG